MFKIVLSFSGCNNELFEQCSDAGQQHSDETWYSVVHL